MSGATHTVAISWSHKLFPGCYLHPNLAQAGVCMYMAFTKLRSRAMGAAL